MHVRRDTLFWLMLLAAMLIGTTAVLYLASRSHDQFVDVDTMVVGHSDANHLGGIEQ